MRRFRPPFRLRPLRDHLALAAALVALCLFGGRWLVERSHQRLLLAEHQSHQAQEATRRAHQAARVAPTPEADFTQRLPSSAHAEEVIRHATRYAQAHGVQVGSLSVEHRPAGGGELAQSRISLSMAGAYPLLKAWLADMLERNQALAVETLVLRRGPGAMQELQLVLVLFTRD